MITRIAAILLLCVPEPVMADALTLGCSGTVTSSSIPKDGIAADPTKEDIKDFSVVVDFDHKAVSGFWAELNGVHPLLPIVAADANSITFKASKKVGTFDSYIEGSVDRITGATQAMETHVYPKSTTMMNWDLYCKPTRPLF